MDTFSALADPTRRHIIELLAKKGTLPATSISSNFRMSPPAISQHLKVLHTANLVSVEKKAQQRLYKINPNAIDEIETWLHMLKKQWEARFDRLDILLAKEQKKRKGVK